ncbi:MAG: SIMPL domain-containing protein [Gammaproteobacteria bacterium]|nr:SIMPL domain-containing protein [Gammaproteobacteria bacterium]
MKKLTLVVGLLLILSSHAISSQQLFSSLPGIQDSTIPSVTVQGHGSMTMPPDQAALRFSISDKGRSLDLIKNNVGNITSRFLEFAENLGIKKQNLRTTNINIFPEYTYVPKTGKRIFDGYRINRDITVNLQNLTLLGQLIEGAINLGVNNINPPMFSSKNASGVNIKLHTLAMEDAKNKAIALATSVNATIGRAIDANAVPISFQPRPTEMRMLSADQATMNEQNYEVGEITHQLSIIATFELIY